MSFHLAGLLNHSTQPNIQGTVQGTSAAGVSPAGQNASQGNLDLPIGATVSGTVVRVEGDTAYIRMDGSDMIQARMESTVSMTEGSNVTFEVSGMTDGQIVLRSLFQNTALQATAEKALMQAGIEVNANSLSMTSEMMRNGMPVDKEALQEMYRDVISYPQMSGANIVAMNRLQIPLSDVNVNQFQAYMNLEHQISTGVGQMTDALLDAFNGLMQTDDAKAAELMQRLVDVFAQEADGLDGVQGTQQAQDQTALQGTLAENAEGILEDGASTEETAAQTGKIIIAEEPDGAQTGRVQQGGAQAENAASAALAEGAAAAADVPAEGASYLEALQKIAQMQQSSESEALRQPHKAEASAPENRAQAAQQEDFSKLLQEIGVSKEALQKYASGELSDKALLGLIKSALAETGTDAQLFSRQTALFENKDFQELLKNEIGRQLLMQPQTVADKGEVEAYYTRLLEQTGKLSQSLSDILPQNTQAMQDIANIRDNLDFMNQLNQTMSYIQLPLKLQGNEAHGDLYVYTNKKSLAESDGSVSAYLHLDMDHLGPVDVYVAMQNQKVSTNFYLRDDEMIDFISSRIDQLNERLTKKGYQMSMNVTKKEKETGVMQEIIEDHRENMLVSTTSFDVRA